MSISQKITLMLLMLASTFLVATYYIQKEIVFPAFYDIENQQAKQSMDRIDELLSESIDSINRQNYDYSSWDHSYKFVQDGNDNYKNSNSLDDNFLDLEIDLVYFLNLQGDVVWGYVTNASEVDAGKNLTSVYISQSILLLKDHMNSIDLTADSDDQFVKGIYNHHGEPVIYSIRPILKSDGDGPAQGYLIMGKILNDKLIKNYQNRIKTKFSVKVIDKLNVSDIILDSDVYDIEEIDNETLKITKVFAFNKEPVIQVTKVFYRGITLNGMNSIQYGLITIFIVGLFSILMIWILIKFNVIRPLLRLTEQIQSITVNSDYTLRSTITNKDEIGVLAREFNQMLSLIEKADTELKAVNKNLEMQSITDPLTGLPNRLNFENKLNIDWSSLRRSNQPLSILMVDIDFFKNFNDHYGHQAGDQCLQNVASILGSCMQRASDMAARFGGEEFILIMPRHDLDSAKIVAEKIQRAFARKKIPHANSDISDFLTICIGISSVIPSKVNSISDLISDADTALYIAKQNGRNRNAVNP
jgi:diguanylate cyclase (GGDEF)-like protein